MINRYDGFLNTIFLINIYAILPLITSLIDSWKSATFALAWWSAASDVFPTLYQLAYEHDVLTVSHCPGRN